MDWGCLLVSFGVCHSVNSGYVLEEPPLLSPSPYLCLCLNKEGKGLHIYIYIYIDILSVSLSHSLFAAGGSTISLPLLEAPHNGGSTIFLYVCLLVEAPSMHEAPSLSLWWKHHLCLSLVEAPYLSLSWWKHHLSLSLSLSLCWITLCL